MGAAYLFRRLLHAALVIVGVATIVFVLTHMTGDPTALLVPPEATEQQRQVLKHDLGLDRPIYEQYVAYLGSLARGDLGNSYRQRRPAMQVIVERVPATLALVATSGLFALVLGVGIGILSAAKRGTAWDRFGTTFALAGQALPSFWTGIVGILIISVLLGWLPASGGGDFKHLILPALTLGSALAGIVVRLVRSSVLDVLVQYFIRTARAKGLSEPRLYTAHVLKNAAVPVATILGLQLSALLGGSLITETVFNYPGIGLSAVNAIFQRDFPVVQAYVIVTSIAVVVVNLLVDATYLYLDPRIRY
jgi:peptide/nickel transport system permease protein